MLSCDIFRKTDLGINLIANAFRGSIQNTILFDIFFIYVLSIIFLFGKRKGAYSCLPVKDSLNYSLSLFKGWFHLWSFCSIQNAYRCLRRFVKCHIVVRQCDNVHMRLNPTQRRKDKKKKISH